MLGDTDNLENSCTDIQEALGYRSLKQGSANFSVKVQSKYFRLSRSHGLCCNYPTVPLSHEISQRQYANKGARLCSNEIFLTKTGCGICQPLVYCLRKIRDLVRLLKQGE